MAEPKEKKETEAPRVSVVLRQLKVCKSCVRYGIDSEDGKDIGNSFYLQNKAFKELGEPEEIKITISSV